MVSLVFTCLTTWHDKEEMVIAAPNVGHGAVMGAPTVLDYATKRKHRESVPVANEKKSWLSQKPHTIFQNHEAIC